MSLPGIAIRGIGRIYDIQVAATRLMLQTQASAASVLGWPDYSGLFRIGDERVRRVFSAGTERLLILAEQANETTSEVQRQVGRMLETQAVQEAKNWQRGLEEISEQAEQSLEELKELARQQAEVGIRMAESIGDQSREAMHQGAEQFTQTMSKTAEEGRQFAAQQEQEMREQAERAEARATAEEVRSEHERQTSKRKAA